MWVENYRCFRERQTARLAPLTLLVGDNSTGKTSFLAMARSLLDIFEGRPADFNAAPFDLGDFGDIAHDRGRGGRADDFVAGFSDPWIGPNRQASSPSRFEATFRRHGRSPTVERARFEWEAGWLLVDPIERELRFGESGKAWCWSFPRAEEVFDADPLASPWLAPLQGWRGQQETCRALNHDDSPSDRLIDDLIALSNHRQQPEPAALPPMGPSSQRTCDPCAYPLDGDEGDVAMFLADAFRSRPRQWEAIRYALEAFGKRSGLFDEITVRASGKRPNAPFRLCLRKTGKRRKGPYRNLIDMGTGVSQVLPVLTDLLRADAPTVHLIQQPEAYLHPIAQAALGTLLCELAAGGKQLLVETHSDYLMNRIRMDARDGTTQLRPEQASIVYFERGDLDVRIHSLEVDAEGNIIGAPPGYRQFFMEELDRSLR